MSPPRTNLHKPGLGVPCLRQMKSRVSTEGWKHNLAGDQKNGKQNDNSMWIHNHVTWILLSHQRIIHINVHQSHMHGSEVSTATEDAVDRLCFFMKGEHLSSCSATPMSPRFPLIPHVLTDMLEWEWYHMIPYACHLLHQSTTAQVIWGNYEFWIHLSTDFQTRFSIASARIISREKINKLLGGLNF